MKKKGKDNPPKEIAIKSALDELVYDIVRWKYDSRSREKSLVEMLREKYTIKRR